jgi:hypothetical protein
MCIATAGLCSEVAHLTFRVGSARNGAGKGIIDLASVSEGANSSCPNFRQLVPEGDLLFAIAEVLQMWLLGTCAR